MQDGAESAGQAFQLDWLKLDNAAKIYPASYSDSSPQSFRLWMELDGAVKLSALQEALERCIRRCPYYHVYLRRGLFWYYLERHEESPVISLLDDAPVAPIPIRRRGTPLFSVKTRGRTVALDVSHVLTDGFGGLTFLATLVADYLRQLGCEVPAGGYVLNPDEPPPAEEFEDAYKRNFRRGMPPLQSLAPAYHIPGILPAPRFRAITGRMSTESALSLSRARGVSLTEYLSALYMHAIGTVREESGGTGRGRSIIRLEVPVNMRRFYPSPTMRNFSLFVSPELDQRSGSYSLDETVRRVHHAMRMQVDPHELGAQIARNVAAELNPLIRAVPLALKDRYLSHLHYRFGDNLYSGILSNLGRVSLPEPMTGHVKRLGFSLGANPVIKKVCAALSYSDELSISFGSVIENRELERHFFTLLQQEGVAVTVEETP